MKKIRIGNGYDVHAFKEGDKITLGGVEIKHNKAFVAHSDGDVAIHAICDAILGALSMGDIGKHFPDNDMSFKGIDSKILLKKVCNLIEEMGYEIGNIDCTIAAQRPKLRDYIDLMRETLAVTIGIEVEDISIKATTTERLGFVGREEGIESFASVLLYPKQ
ncbi:MAG: 2-C-methyl-D-erythritol 2,4-cyclodiphosphate synthase [Rikenellaceae bacterium]